MFDSQQQARSKAKHSAENKTKIAEKNAKTGGEFQESLVARRLLSICR